MMVLPSEIKLVAAGLSKLNNTKAQKKAAAKAMAR